MRWLLLNNSIDLGISSKYELFWTSKISEIPSCLHIIAYVKIWNFIYFVYFLLLRRRGRFCSHRVSKTHIWTQRKLNFALTDRHSTKLLLIVYIYHWSIFVLFFWLYGRIWSYHDHLDHWKLQIKICSLRRYNVHRTFAIINLYK